MATNTKVDSFDDVESVADDAHRTTFQRGRRLAFYLATVATLALAGVMTNQELLMAFSGWFTDLGIHQVHDMAIFSMLWIAYVVPLALLLYRPSERVNTVLAPLVFLVPTTIFAGLAGSPLLMLPLLFGGLALVVFALHPAGRDLLRFDRVTPVNRLLVGMLVVAAIPLLVYAADQTIRQLTVVDEHTLFAHYGFMAIAATYVVVMGALAVFRRRDWRFAAYSAAAMAIVIGVSSVLFSVESSVGPLWGAAAIVFGITFVLGVEYVRRFQVGDADAPVEGPDRAESA